MSKPLFSRLFNAKKSAFFCTLVAMTRIMAGCSDNGTKPNGGRDDSDIEITGTVTSVNRFVAEPTQNVGNDKITQSFTYDGYDFYYIRLGILRNALLYPHPAQHQWKSWNNNNGLCKSFYRRGRSIYWLWPLWSR